MLSLYVPQTNNYVHQNFLVITQEFSRHITLSERKPCLAITSPTSTQTLFPCPLILPKILSENFVSINKALKNWFSILRNAVRIFFFYFPFFHFLDNVIRKILYNVFRPPVRQNRNPNHSILYRLRFPLPRVFCLQNKQ